MEIILLNPLYSSVVQSSTGTKYVYICLFVENYVLKAQFNSGLLKVHHNRGYLRVKKCNIILSCQRSKTVYIKIILLYIRNNVELTIIIINIKLIDNISMYRMLAISKPAEQLVAKISTLLTCSKTSDNNSNTLTIDSKTFVSRYFCT